MRHFLLLIFVFAICGLFYWTCSTIPDSYASKEFTVEEAQLTSAASVKSPLTEPLLEVVSREQVAGSKPETSSEKKSKAASGPRENQLLRVVSAETGEAIANAVVWTYQEDYRNKRKSIWENSPSNWDPEEYARQHADEFRTDANGRVFLPSYPWGQIYLARKGELYGYSLGFSNGLRVLKLRKDEGLKVRAVDQANRPVVGLPLGLVRFEEGKPYALTSSTVLTNAEGMAVIPHLQYWASKFPRAKLRVQAFVLLNAPASVGLPRKGEIAMLTLPPMGRVVLVDDTPNPEAMQYVRMVWDSAPGTDWYLENRNWYQNERGDYLNIMLNGRSVYPFVGLGMQLAFQVSSTVGAPESFVFGFGPEAAGQEVILKTDGGKSVLTVQLQILDESGNPIRNHGMQIGYQTGSSSTSGGRDYPTDENGFIQIVVGGGRLFRKLNESTVMKIETAMPYVGKPAQGVIVLGKLEPGLNDRGRLRLDSSRLLISGRIVDEQGSPLANVWINAFTNDGEEDGLGFEVTDETGEFIIFGDAGGPDFKLSITCKGFLPYHEVHSVGSFKTDVVLQQGARLSGQVLFSPAIPANVFSVKFIPRDEDIRSSLFGLNDDGSFDVTGVMATPGRLEIIHAQQATIFRSFDFVTPSTTEEGMDMRLNKIDLRGFVFQAEVAVQSVTGEEIPYARFQGRDKRNGQLRGRCNGVGRISLYLPENDFPGRVHLPGFIPREIDLREGNQIIQLEEGVEIEFRLEPMPELPEGVVVEGVLALSEGNMRSKPLIFNAEGVALTEVPGFGDYRASVFLRKGGTTLGRIRVYHRDLLTITNATIADGVIFVLNQSQVDDLVQKKQ